MEESESILNEEDFFTDLKIVVSGENSVQIQFEQKISVEVNERISSFVKYFRLNTSDVPEIFEVVPTYCAVTVYFDDERISLEEVKNYVQESLAEASKELKNRNETSSSVDPRKVIKIPVCYEDEEFAPDLKDVAQYTGLSCEEVVKLHSETEYLIYMLGFLPGFPYLGGLDEKLATPRLETPRTKIPAGSVAIGGKQTGLYPESSPGGWRIIGRTPLKVFDKEREPACFYEAGDLIRFERISREEFDAFDEQKWRLENGIKESTSESKILQRYVCGGGIKVLEGGISTTIQDYGRKGFERFGIGQGGVMDVPAFRKANRLCCNPDGVPCLEAVLQGPSLEFVTDMNFAITGCRVLPKLNGQIIKTDEKISAHAGDVLECGYVQEGLRMYIAFEGGILSPENFGSCSDNRKLKAGEQLAIGWLREKERHQIFEGIENETTASKGILELKCLPGPQYDFFSKNDLRNFQKNEYIVSAESNRMGIRFEGKSLECGSTDIISDGIPFGSVQITSKGLPVVMAADRQTTGGYAKIAIVTRESMYRLAQAVPGTKVRFNF